MSIDFTNPKYTLLYIEDEAHIRMVTTMFLEPYFTTIIEASNGIEAIELYYKHKPDVIITDIEMPNMNGLEFCKKIRKEDKSTPIIITTAYTSVEYLLEAVSLNLIKYLGKPLKEDEVLEALEICFEQLNSNNPSVVRLNRDLYYDLFNHSLFRKEQLITIPSSQQLLLDILIKNRNRVVTYTEIEYEIWYDKVMTADSLRTLVRKLRKVVGKEVIENISKTGYKINLYG